MDGLPTDNANTIDWSTSTLSSSKQLLKERNNNPAESLILRDYITN